MGVDSPGRVVFFSFPLDAVPESGPIPDNEVVLLRNALNFLAPGANGAASLTLDSPSYTVPDQVTVQLGDIELAGAGQAVVTFSASSATNIVPVTVRDVAPRFVSRISHAGREQHHRARPTARQQRGHHHRQLF